MFIMMRKGTVCHFFRVLLGCGALLLITAGLFANNINLTRLIIVLLSVDALYLSISHGLKWWRGNQSNIVLRERFLTFLASLMFLFLMSGTALFMQAFVYEGMDDGNTRFLNSEYLLRSLACSFQLFTGNIDSNVLDGISTHPILKGVISFQAILSFSCTIAILLSLAYSRVYAYMKLRFNTKIDNLHNHLYIFFGMDEPSCLLAKSIKNREGDRAVIVFVESRTMSDDEPNGWSSIVSIFTHRRKSLIDADELDARVTITEVRLCDINIEKLGKAADILGDINLIKLRDLINQLAKSINDAQMHVFFLSENEDENIRGLSVLSHDKTILHIKNNIRLRFYCHARYNGLNRTVEDMAIRRGIDVRIVDSSYMAVEILKSEGNNHPICFVDIDKEHPTTVKSPFNSLIIGFDEVGRDALKFLYEYGAFVDSNASVNNERRSHFHCVVVDKHMNELRGTFANFAPSVMKQKNQDGSPLIELRTCDCRDSVFFETVVNQKYCENLNYVVIAVGDDNIGMTMAIRLLNHVRRFRADLRQLRIYVRSYRPDKEDYMLSIAKYYNDGYNNGLSENEPYQTDAVIKVFGQAERIYSYDMIINEELTNRGRAYQKGYAMLRGESTLWDDRRRKEQGKGSLDSLRKLRRQELQDLSNALHADTKLYLLKNAMPNNFDWNDFLSRYFDDNNMPIREGSYDKIKYPLLTNYENEVILNLARLEHLRWYASHEMLGYTQSGKNIHCCDERTRQHNCLRPWHDMDAESIASSSGDWTADYKMYDYGVIDNTILLNKNKL